MGSRRIWPQLVVSPLTVHAYIIILKLGPHVQQTKLENEFKVFPIPHCHREVGK